MIIMALLKTCGFAFFGAWIAKKLKIPSGLVIGAILSVAIANLTIGVAPVPYFMKWATQVIAGAYIGVGLDRESVRKLRHLIKPALIIVVGLITINITLGLILYRITSLDLCTALFATVPGGLSEMSVISEEMGANTPLVSVFQLSRMITTVCTFPLFITHILKAQKQAPDSAETVQNRQATVSRQKCTQEFLIALAVAGLGGLLGRYSGFPGGVLLFSAVITCLLQIRFGFGVVPRWSKRLAQVIVGGYVGAQVTMDVVASVSDIWYCIILVVVSYLVFCLSIGWFLSKITALDKVTAAFSAAPAGSSDMALIASDYDVEPSAIAVLQMIRLILVIAICPSLITLILKLQAFFLF